MTAREPAHLLGAYDDSAAAFAHSADRLVYSVLAGPLVAAVRALLDGGEGLVLDVAAGTGAFGRSFGRVVALDVAREQLGRNGSRLRVRADAYGLPFGNDSFAAAGCAFGINHVHHPDELVAEMARVAPVVGVSTWVRPDQPFAPKQIVHDALERQVGKGRTPVGEELDRLTEQVGSVGAVTRLLEAARLDAQVTTVSVTVPWPGVHAYLDYRLSMPSTARPADRAALRDEVAVLTGRLTPGQLEWCPALVIGTGQRTSDR